MWVIWKALFGWSTIGLGLLIIMMGFVLGGCSISLGMQGASVGLMVDPGKLAPLVNQQ